MTTTIQTRPASVQVPIGPISAPESERLVIAGCLTDSKLADDVLLLLEPAAISDATLSLVAHGIRSLRSVGKPVDPVGVFRELRKQGQLTVTLPALNDLAAIDPGETIVRYHAQIVHHAYMLEQAADVTREVARRIYQDGADAGEVLSYATGEFARISDGLVATAQDVVTMEESAAEVEEQYKSGVAPGLMTGYHDLDDLTGGLHGGDLIILAARPSVGKSALVLCLGQNIAETGGSVFVVEMEMRHTDLTKRLLARLTKIDGQRIRLHSLRPDELPTLMAGLRKLARLPIRIFDRGSLKVRALVARVRAWHASLSEEEKKRAILIVDYLQLMQGDERRNDRRDLEIGEISRGLKNLALDLDIPVLALSQLSRAVEGRTNHVPMMSDLRESGNIEQDADVVIFLYREELYEPKTEKLGIVELHVAKHRNGPLCVVPLRFEPNTMSFENISYRTPDGY